MKPTKVPKRPPTLKDVALVAGVSPNTVSVILNQRPRAKDYSEKTRETVWAAAKQLGYMPNPLAQVLKRKHSNLVGLAVFTRESCYYLATLQSADETIQAAGFQTITADMGHNQERLREALNTLTAWRVEGVLAILGGHTFDRTPLFELQESGIPVVMIGPQVAGQALPCVNVDNRQAGEAIAHHLIGLGHRTIAVMAGDHQHDCSAGRIEGMRNVLKGEGITLGEESIVWARDCRFEVSTGYHAIDQILEMNPRPTAVMSINDEMALGAMSRARELGVKIPGDLSITGFDDAFIGDSSFPENRLGMHTVPPLTTMRLPLRSMGREAAHLLVQLIHGELHSAPPYPIRLPAELIVRGSVGPA
ncbi:MAG TPA: LacI family DNA-binding transcriptional regulator [Candidatus Hydrogenedentes bacterium]|nr:LacI family DNA-binding transcriptional regulator [Candidatus Hydrogenedentota bacterium]